MADPFPIPSAQAYPLTTANVANGGAMMTLDELRALSEKATPGAWEGVAGDVRASGVRVLEMTERASMLDVDFAAACVNYVRELLAVAGPKVTMQVPALGSAEEV
jgi:hypothetical protein